MKNTEQRRPWILTAGLWLVLIAVGVYYTWFRNTEHTNPTADTDSQIQTAPEPKPIRYPIELPKAETDTQTIATTSPQPPPEPPLPKLFESDQRVLELLHQSIDNESLSPVLIPQHIIARVVTTIDNLTPAKLATNALPVKPVPGAIQVKHMNDRIYLSEQNSKRYSPYITLLEKVESADIVAIYRKLYPLFQESYKDLGDPTAYFNDRLVEVIDHLLETPEPTLPIELVQPKVFLEYADPALEAASAGQKILLRVGPENAAKIKAKLREIRAELTAKNTAGH